MSSAALGTAAVQLSRHSMVENPLNIPFRRRRRRPVTTSTGFSIYPSITLALRWQAATAREDTSSPWHWAGSTIELSLRLPGAGIEPVPNKKNTYNTEAFTQPQRNGSWPHTPERQAKPKCPKLTNETTPADHKIPQHPLSS